MKKYLTITNTMTSEEQRKRTSLNTTFDRMRELNRFNENEVKNYLLNQLSYDTYGGYILTYEEALNYYNELTT